ncbi:unnamed protein product [Mytilus edulis]|uniref:Uncharacterized protein n=1 Tax=Mytilus edulis TaxID=6550 RepID=A0A8S3SY18_MYTED|nr:unnamed protein product [Mytilus edulis]
MAQGYPLHIPGYPLYYIGLKYLPESVLEKLADILDVPGIICMELFAEMINREHEHKLDLDTSRVQAFRYQVGQRPTKLLFRHLMKLGITIGQVQYVLDKMGAATHHIFINRYNDITEMYNHDMMKYPSTSTATASEHNCTCIGCRERDVRDSQIYTYSNHPRYEADRSSTSPPNPHSLRPQTNDNQTNRRPDGQIQNDPNRQRYVARKYPLSEQTKTTGHHIPSQPGQRQIEPDWIHPSECECQCGDINCKECEERRLLDPEETTVLSSYPHREYRNQPMNMARSNIFSSRTTGHVSVNDEMNINNNVQIDYVSYSENPSSSFSLRACPDGDSYSSSMKSSITSKHSCSNTDTLKCTCKKPPVCTCRKGEVQSSCSGDDRKRFSTPVEKLYASEIDSSRLSVPSISDSDPNLSTNPYNRRTSIDQSGNNILISYTDDVKSDVIRMAGDLKSQGHTVNTDLHKDTFLTAKKQGCVSVSEQDQYTWLRNRYNHADYIIICSSKGYIEAINLDDKVCPSPHYLNAKYIFELIMQDPRKSEKTIEICFQNTYVKDKLCLPFTRKFILPNEMASLSDQIRR